MYSQQLRRLRDGPGKVCEEGLGPDLIHFHAMDWLFRIIESCPTESNASIETKENVSNGPHNLANAICPSDDDI